MGCAPPRLVSSVGGQHLWGLDSEAGGGRGGFLICCPRSYTWRLAREKASLFTVQRNKRFAWYPTCPEPGPVGLSEVKSVIPGVPAALIQGRLDLLEELLGNL